MNSETVDLIATDPPFNKGRDFHATRDSLAAGAMFQDRWSWEKDVHEEWLDLITDDHPDLMLVIQNSRKTYGDDMGAFLCFMALRLLAMRRLLKRTGSIYLHCDPTASHYVKMLMDAVFGRKNFRNEIVWCYAGNEPATPKQKRLLRRYIISERELAQRFGCRHVYWEIMTKWEADYFIKKFRKATEDRKYKDLSCQ